MTPQLNKFFDKTNFETKKKRQLRLYPVSKQKVKF